MIFFHYAHLNTVKQSADSQEDKKTFTRVYWQVTVLEVGIHIYAARPRLPLPFFSFWGGGGWQCVGVCTLIFFFSLISVIEVSEVKGWNCSGFKEAESSNLALAPFVKPES